MPKVKNLRSENSNKNVVSLSSARVGAGKKSNFSPRAPEEEVRRRAYELYEQRGRMPGCECEDWLRAEQEIAARHQDQQGA